MSWPELLALVTFGVAGSGSPGPNNALLLTSGVRFGFKATLPHVVGGAAGVGVMVMATAAGIGALIEAVPGSQTVLRVIGSAYLLYLAWRLVGSRATNTASAAKPLSVWEAGVFQFVNPKAWIFAIAVVAAFLPPAMPAVSGGALLTAILTIVMAFTFGAWALGGAALGRLLVNERAAHTVNRTLALLLIASVALLWA